MASASVLDLSRTGARLIGVVHLGPLPGAPRFVGSMQPLLDAARADAAALAEGGVDAIIVENFGDAPFRPGSVDPETIAGLTRALVCVQREVGALPLGVNVLRNDARAALGIAAALELAFLRVNVHSGSAVTDQGLIHGRADETLRERARLGAGVRIFADVHVKHATPLGTESIADAAAEASGRGLADALIVSGRGTGQAPEPADLRAVAEAAPTAPLWIGSGLDERNADELLRTAHGAICGTALKRGGRLEEPVDVERVRRLRACFPG